MSFTNEVLPDPSVDQCPRRFGTRSWNGAQVLSATRILYGREEKAQSHVLELKQFKKMATHLAQK